jgi:hypothetical protein
MKCAAMRSTMDIGMIWVFYPIGTVHIFSQLVKKADELLRVVKRRLPIGDAARSDHAMHSISTTLTSFQWYVFVR